jgi:hypothetical protein
VPYQQSARDGVGRQADACWARRSHESREDLPACLQRCHLAHVHIVVVAQAVAPLAQPNTAQISAIEILGIVSSVGDCGCRAAMVGAAVRRRQSCTTTAAWRLVQWRQRRRKLSRSVPPATRCVRLQGDAAAWARRPI